MLPAHCYVWVAQQKQRQDLWLCNGVERKYTQPTHVRQTRNFQRNWSALWKLLREINELNNQQIQRTLSLW